MAKRSIVRCMRLLLPELMIVYGIIPYARPLGMSVYVYPGLLIICYVSGNLMGGLESWQFGSWIVLFSVVIHVSLPTELRI